MNKRLSIIIVTFKSNDVVCECLKSIQKFNDIGEGLEVIVVDNHPVEGNAFGDIAAEFPWVITISDPENGGFGKGNNKGVSISHGEYILFLNPDTELVEPIFEYAIDKFVSEPKLAVFGMLLYDQNGKIWNNSFGIMPEYKRLLPSYFWLPFIKYLDYTPQHIFPLGADMFVRKNVFEEAGGFDENMFLCYEEPDLIRRIPNAYYVKIFNKKILHLEGHITETVGVGRRINWALESEQYYFSKYKLNYAKFSVYALTTLWIKKMARAIAGRSMPHADSLLVKHYWRFLRETKRY